MSPSCSLPVSNAPKVVLFLVNHKNERCNTVLLDIFKRFVPSSDDILLHEDCEYTVPHEFQALKKCWEKTEIVTNFEQKSREFDLFYDVAQNFSGSSYTTKYRLDAAKKIKTMAKEADLDAADLDIEQVQILLNDNASCSLRLENIGVKLTLIVQRLFILLKNNTVKSTFHERQTALIEEIGNSLKFRRVFVVCGSHHGDPDTSIFPQEANRLLSFLKEKATFEIIDTTI